jgi:hypothetical protein
VITSGEIAPLAHWEKEQKLAMEQIDTRVNNNKRNICP